MFIFQEIKFIICHSFDIEPNAPLSFYFLSFLKKFTTDWGCCYHFHINYTHHVQSALISRLDFLKNRLVKTY